MTRFERQDAIYAEIQQIESDLEQCQTDSPDYLPLLKKLNAALKEYNSVPSDDVRRKEINSRLDQLQASAPTQESMDEFFSLCKELHSLPPSTSPWNAFRRTSHQLRVPLWLLTLASALAAFLPYGEAWLSVTMLLCFFASLAWSVWASTYTP